jgi:hypothetical protein
MVWVGFLSSRYVIISDLFHLLLMAWQALLLANNERGLFGSIQETVCGILCFGTPLDGRSVEEYQAVLSRMADVLIFPNHAEKLMELFRSTLLESLGRIADAHLRLAPNFRACIEGVHFSSFVEKSALPGLSDVVSGY